MSDERSKPALEAHDPLGEQIVGTTAQFCNIYGGCLKCVGWATVEQLRRFRWPGLGDDLPGDQVVFCAHACHLAAQKQ